MAGKGGGSAEGVTTSGAKPKIQTPFTNAIAPKPKGSK
jgi:hypothetical protein